MPPENLQETPEENKTPARALRTYQGDVEEAISKRNASKTTILVAEQERRGFNEVEQKGEVDTRVRNKVFIWSGVVLLFLGIITIGVVYYIKATNQVVVIQKTKALIAFSQEKDIQIAKMDRGQLVRQIVSEDKSFNQQLNYVLYLNYINPDLSSISALNFMSLLAPQIPGALLRSFEKKYMLGIYSFDTNEPFIILTTNDYATSYSGMLSWEKNLVSDVGPIFGLNNATSTTTFVDEERQNKDLRILKDGGGKTILVYSFIDKNTLVITANENILNAVVSKYLISKQTR